MIATAKGGGKPQTNSVPSYRRPTLASTTAHLDDDNFSRKLVNKTLIKKRQSMASSAPVRSRPLNVQSEYETYNNNNKKKKKKKS